MTDVTGSGEMLPSIVPAHGLVVVGDGPGRHIHVETEEAAPPSLPSGIRAKSLDLLTLCWCRGPGSSYASVQAVPGQRWRLGQQSRCNSFLSSSQIKTETVKL